MTDSASFDWTLRLSDCLSSTLYMALSTLDPESATWVCPVYYVWDKNYNFYFTSMPHTRHMLNIQKDKCVAGAIFSTEQGTQNHALGVQFSGEALILHDSDSISAAYELYVERIEKDTGEEAYWKLSDFIDHNAKWHFVRITPNEIHLFDTENFGHERQKIPLNESY